MPALGVADGSVAVNKPVVVIGAGGHAKVVIAALRAAGRQVVGCAVRDIADVRGSILGVPLIHEDSLPANAELMLGVGDNRLRQRLAAKLGGQWTTCIHPSATVADGAMLGPGTFVCAGAVVQPDARLGAHVIVNTCASVDHDCLVGDFAHIAPGARLAGEVQLGDGALIGLGAVVVVGRAVGAWAIVGAGAAVVHDVAPATTVVGVPARPITRRS